MSETAHQSCPICRVEVTPSLRYPHYLCGTCAAKATNEDGRPLLFFNESFSGGFIAQYADTGEVRNSHICFINGVQCWADEDYYGGDRHSAHESFKPTPHLISTLQWDERL